ncbi:hypothetical protein DFJ77DRAFT_459860 [Powellomyces hirtus]|nr:hypothetical protein DFJ77DRAFT_459860 [Powellomyces hirtus]
MLALDPALSAAEALVSLHTAPIHQSFPDSDAQSQASASESVPEAPQQQQQQQQQLQRLRASGTRGLNRTSPSDMPVTDKHMDWQPTNAATLTTTEKPMDWQATPATTDSSSFAASAREQHDDARLGLGLGPLDGLTGDIPGRFEALRSDIMAVDGSMDLDNYLLSTYDIHAPTYKDVEERNKNKTAGSTVVAPSASSSKSKPAAGIHNANNSSSRRKAGNGIKLKPLNEINLLRSARRIPPDTNSEERVPLPSIRAILSGKPAIQASRASIAPAAGPQGSRGDPVHYGPYRMPESAIPIDASTGRPFLLPHMTRGRIISDAPDGRPAVLVRGPIVRTAPGGPVPDVLAPRSTRWLQSAPSGTALDPMILLGRPGLGNITANPREAAACAAEPRTAVKRVTSRTGGVPHPHPPPPVDELVHRQQHHIQELHQQNVWLQQQLLAQSQAGIIPSPPHQPDAPATAACGRRSCTPCPHHQHSHPSLHHLHATHPSLKLYRHAHHHHHAPHPLSTAHKKKPYSVPDAPSSVHGLRPRLKHVSHSSSSAAPASSLAASTDVAPTPPQPHLPSPASSSLSPAAISHTETAAPAAVGLSAPSQQSAADASLQQPHQPQQDSVGGHKQTIAKLGEFLRKASTSNASATPDKPAS